MITKYTAKLHDSFFQLLVSTTTLTRDNALRVVVQLEVNSLSKGRKISRSARNDR